MDSIRRLPAAPFREALSLMDPTRNRNLIWLAGETNLAMAWDVAVAQMVAARRAGDRVDAARWEADADTLYVQITGRRPDAPSAQPDHSATSQRDSGSVRLRPLQQHGNGAIGEGRHADGLPALASFPVESRHGS
jgi:hypothetical protein